MASVNTPLNKLFTRVSLIAALLLLVACGATNTKEDQVAAPKEVKLTPTKAYLPVRQYDKEGLVIQFVAAPNPYDGMKSKISKDSVVNFIEARKAYKSKNFDKAEAILNTIIVEDKTLAGPWVMLGDIAVQKGDANSALGHYQKAIKVNPLNVNAYLPLAKLQRQQGEFIKAQNTYAKALAVWKDFPEAHLNLAILYDIYLNDPLQAQQHMEAFQFLTDYKDKKVAQWLSEIQKRTGIAPNLYIGPSNTSQIEKSEGDKSDS